MFNAVILGKSSMHFQYLAQKLCHIHFFIIFRFSVRSYSQFDFDGRIVTVNWTPYLGEATAFSILRFPNIEEINLSGCDNIVANDFVDCIGFCTKLRSVILDGCVQFSQYHFVKIFQNLKNVEQFSLVKCCKMPFTPTYCVCSFLPKLVKN